MTTNSDSAENVRLIAEEAAAWRVILDTRDSRRMPEFWNWVTRSPGHVREALVMGLLSRALQELEPDHPVGSASDGDAALSRNVTVPSHTRKVGRWRFAAAVAACGALLIVTLPLLRGLTHRGTMPQIYTTNVGEQRSLALQDGSIVVLDAQSRLKIELSERERSVELEGQAFFTVARDAKRPFRVRGSSAVIEVIGTQFNVRTDRGTQVAVLEGAVQLKGNRGVPLAMGHLTAGQGATVSQNGEITDHGAIDPEVVTAWEKRRLVFSRVPLEEIVREFNRYSVKKRMRVQGAAARLSFGGVFDATDPSPLLFMLSKNPSIVLEQHGDEFVIREKEPR